MNLDRKIIDAIRAVLQKDGFENLTAMQSTHTLSLVGNKGSVRVTVHFTDGREQPHGVELNPNIPEAYQIAVRPRLDDISRIASTSPVGAAATVVPPVVVVVVDMRAKENPGFSRISRPADLYLNGECTDADGYYLEQANLVPL